MTDLVNCPFCGGEGMAALVQEANYHLGRCGKCYSDGPPRIAREDAIAAWNRRASDARLAELAEALRPFAKRADYFDERLKANGGKWEDDDTYCDDPPSDIYLKELRDARAAIAKDQAAETEGETESDHGL